MQSKMGLKEKVFGIVLIIWGALPFFLKIDIIREYIESYDLLYAFTPGEIIYQLVIIVLGFFLIFKLKPRVGIESH